MSGENPWACRIGRAVLRVAGPDAEAFLQGQLSQDVAALELGTSSWSFILQPQGRVDAFLRVTRMGAEEFVLDTDGDAAPVVQRLQRFKLRTEADIEALGWSCVVVRGPGAEGVAATGEIRAPVPTGGVDVLGLDPQVPQEVAWVDEEVYEAHRIRAGFPRMGVDINERTIPAETCVLDWAVSFTKGCYTGQELVARMDSRGSSAPRYLRLLQLQGRTVPPAGTPVADADGSEVGAVSSAAWDAATESVVALAYLKRSFAVPAPVNVADTTGAASAVPR